MLHQTGHRLHRTDGLLRPAIHFHHPDEARNGGRSGRSGRDFGGRLGALQHDDCQGQPGSAPMLWVAGPAAHSTKKVGLQARFPCTEYAPIRRLEHQMQGRNRAGQPVT